jgi:hypothetical protein
LAVVWQTLHTPVVVLMKLVAAVLAVKLTLPAGTRVAVKPCRSVESRTTFLPTMRMLASPCGSWQSQQRVPPSLVAPCLAPTWRADVLLVAVRSACAFGAMPAPVGPWQLRHTSLPAFGPAAL